MRHKYKGWSTIDDAYLYNNFRSHTDESIAAHLGRTTSSVKSRREVLDLKKGVRATGEHITKYDRADDRPRDPNNMLNISELSARAAACGMSYGQYICASPYEISRAKQKESEIKHNPWAVRVRV